MNNFSIGVDLGGTNLRIAAVDEQGSLIEKVSLGTELSLGRDHVIDEMCNAVARMSDKYKDSARLLGIGIGVPGIIDEQTGLVRKAVNLPGWAGYPVRAEIQRRLKTVAILENDSRVAVLGEKWLGAGQDFPDVAMLTLGTGVGGGLILGNAIWQGANGMGGEFGHMTVDPDGPPCGCGNRGCLEQYASATAVVRMARETAANNRGSALAAAEAKAKLSAESIYRLAMQGDEDARRIFQNVGRGLGIVLASLVNSLNLPIYVIGGGVSSAWEAFAPAMFEELRQRSLVYSITAPEADSSQKAIITRALLGSDAGLYGAARLPMIADAKL